VGLQQGTAGAGQGGDPSGGPPRRGCTNSDKSTVSDEICQNCPENTFSEEGTISLFDCGCNAEYTNKVVMNVSVCEACEAGKYKLHVGAGDCLNCENGKYSTDTGKTSTNDCISCPLNSITLLMDQLQFKVVFVWLVFVKFNLSNISSDFQCNACEIGKYSEMFFTDCERCVRNTTTILIAADSKDKCLCDSGYALNSDLDSATTDETKCVACEPGKYKLSGCRYAKYKMWFWQIFKSNWPNKRRTV